MLNRANLLQILCIISIISGTALVSADTAPGELDKIIPDFSKSGYRNGAPLPATGKVIDLETEYGVKPNDGRDDTAAIQKAVDEAAAKGATAERHLILQLPAGEINISREIRVDVDGVIIRGKGNDPKTGTKIVFNATTPIYEVSGGQPKITGGSLFPGYAGFRVETRLGSVKSPNSPGMINNPGQNGFKLATDALKGSNEISLVSGAGKNFAKGMMVYIGATVTENFYKQVRVSPSYWWKYPTPLYQLADVAAVKNDTLVLDRPLEFDLPVANNDVSKPAQSVVMPVTAVRDVGFENFYYTHSLKGTTYEILNPGVYHAKNNPMGVGHFYANAAPEYAIHGILFKFAENCWVKGVTLEMVGSHPVVTEFAKNLTIVNNTFNGSWNKGKGGHGYVRFSKVFNSVLAYNKISLVRHVALQWSASHNVAAYNTVDCDINLHAGWERYNLIEGNTSTVDYIHQSLAEDGAAEGSTWYPLFWSTGPQGGAWGNTPSGPMNIVFNNSFKKQETENGPMNPWLYSAPGVVYVFGWDGKDWSHLIKDGAALETWSYNENTDFTKAPNGGVAVYRTGRKTLYK